MADRTNGVDCHLLRDLLIPYAASEVSTPTRAWVDQHVAGCPDCREAFEEAVGLTVPPLPAPPPSPGPEQRLMLRMRRTIRIVLGLILALALAVGGLIWSIGQVKRVANIPEVHPVPAAHLSAREAVTVDLSPLRLTRSLVAEAPLTAAGFSDGALARFETAEGEQVHLWAYRFESARQARNFERSWERQFQTKFLQVSSSTWDRSISKFRSGGHFYYTWSVDGWLIMIAVPESVTEPARLRDQIRDLIFIAYTAES